MNMPPQKILALIPARGGSVGIPRKNLQLLGGKPLLVWTIEAAQALGASCRVVVSTDDDEISSCAISAGAEHIRRPADISTGTASSEVALSHSLKFLAEQENYHPDVVGFFQCTAPFRTGKHVAEAYAQFLREGADSLISVHREACFLWRKENESWVPINHPITHRLRRQEIDQFEENGAIYFFKPWILRDLGMRFGGKVSAYELSPEAGFDIDTPLDLETARQFLSEKHDL